MWASCTFIHEMKLGNSGSVYTAAHSLPPFLLGLEASWQKAPCLCVSYIPSRPLFHSYLLPLHSLRIMSQLVG